MSDNLADGIAKGLVLSGRRKFLGREKAQLYEQTLREDIRRAELYLAQRGYPHASIEARFKPKRGDREVELTLKVEPGPPVVVDSVSVEGMPDHLAAKAHEVMAVDPRSVFVESKIKGTVRELKSLLNRAGHARAEGAGRQPGPVAGGDL